MRIWLRFVLAVLATWRITHLLASEDGPFDVIVRFRNALGQSWAGKLLDCFYCLSLWISAPAALFVSRSLMEWIFSWLALSGGACLLERATAKPTVIETLPAMPEGDIDDVLRTETIDAEHCNPALRTNRLASGKPGAAWPSTSAGAGAGQGDCGGPSPDVGHPGLAR